MTQVVATSDESPINPLDIVEQVVGANEWPFERRSDEELSVEVPGKWCDYSLYFAWCEEIGALHFSCALDMRVPRAKRTPIYELLAQVNEKLWLGHFGLWAEDGIPVFRHTELLRGVNGASIEQVEDMVDIAITECERFYPAFQFVVWGGKSPSDAMAAAMIETVGEA